MKIWLDDIRPAPNGYIHCHSVNEAIELSKTAKEPIGNLTQIMIQATMLLTAVTELNCLTILQKPSNIILSSYTQ